MNSDIFTEALIHRLLPYQHEVTLHALKAFDVAAYRQQLWLAGAGALVASVVLYFIGVRLRRLPAKVSTDAQQNRIKKMQVAAGHWLPYLLILSPTPLGGVLIMAAGFFALTPARAGLMILAAEIFWRASPLL